MRTARNKVQVCIPMSGWQEKKISFRHHERRAPDFLKKMAAKKIIMAGNERAPKKIKSKKGEYKSEKTNFSFLLSLRTYSLDAKQEA